MISWPRARGLPIRISITPDRFTNLREAIKFFEQLKENAAQDAEAEPDGSVEAAQEQPDRVLPENTIDRQFVDVLTYHEQRQARLRAALMNS